MARRHKKPRIGQTYIWEDPYEPAQEDPYEPAQEIVTITKFVCTRPNAWIFEGMNHATQELQPVAFNRSYGATNWKLLE